MASFQYISCYCLSRKKQRLQLKVLISIHLMLLFIRSVQSIWEQREYFNTSHVTVYRKRYRCIFCRTTISIHLMLLFIKNFKPKSCALSHFNTSHVTVYHAFVHHSTPLLVISIHLMLLFIDNDR